MSALTLPEKAKLKSLTIWIIYNKQTNELISARLRKGSAVRVAAECGPEFGIQDVSLRFKLAAMKSIVERMI